MNEEVIILREIRNMLSYIILSQMGYAPEEEGGPTYEQSIKNNREYLEKIQQGIEP